MLGTMLRDLRAHIDALATADGRYTLVCGRHGEQPVPADGLWFPTRSVARQAARATTQYRNALRRYDPELPQYDIVVCQGHPSVAEPASSTPAAESTPASPTTLPADSPLVTFCHRVAAAVFETLAAEGYSEAETAVMDAYLDHAETQPTADGLCLRLLESMATVLADRLTPREQAAVLAAAADRLPATPEDSVADAETDPTANTAADPTANTANTATDSTAADPTPDTAVTAVFEALRTRGVVGAYRDTPWLQHRETGTRSILVEVSGYAFSPYGGSLPTLPVVIELYRSVADWQPVAVDVAAITDGWRFRVVPVGEAPPGGLVSASVTPDEPGCP
ncbi:DUF7551 domain-containing protein [Halonotius roseus]|uniref:Uncharacterized protein n=1 Tax=Halonotius roseus TaxID=2511997 RepID=A0A544QNX3_9EURY|nr:hypothetical protein [Halonotius roseus]TQQ80621.1 hypothetical protein EWF95_09060 [Halonotius roseus]